jgi:hypothetical protein
MKRALLAIPLAVALAAINGALGVAPGRSVRASAVVGGVSIARVMWNPANGTPSLAVGGHVLWATAGSCCKSNLWRGDTRQTSVRRVPRIPNLLTFVPDVDGEWATTIEPARSSNRIVWLSAKGKILESWNLPPACKTEEPDSAVYAHKLWLHCHASIFVVRRGTKTLQRLPLNAAADVVGSSRGVWVSTGTMTNTTLRRISSNGAVKDVKIDGLLEAATISKGRVWLVVDGEHGRRLVEVDATSGRTLSHEIKGGPDDLVQVVIAKDELFGLDRAEAVWRYDLSGHLIGPIKLPRAGLGGGSVRLVAGDASVWAAWSVGKENGIFRISLT